MARTAGIRTASAVLMTGPWAAGGLVLLSGTVGPEVAAAAGVGAVALTTRAVLRHRPRSAATRAVQRAATQATSRRVVTRTTASRQAAAAKRRATAAAATGHTGRRRPATSALTSRHGAGTPGRHAGTTLAPRTAGHHTGPGRPGRRTAGDANHRAATSPRAAARARKAAHIAAHTPRKAGGAFPTGKRGRNKSGTGPRGTAPSRAARRATVKAARTDKRTRDRTKYGAGPRGWSTARRTRKTHRWSARANFERERQAARIARDSRKMYSAERRARRWQRIGAWRIWRGAKWIRRLCDRRARTWWGRMWFRFCWSFWSLFGAMLTAPRAFFLAVHHAGERAHARYRAYLAHLRTWLSFPWLSVLDLPALLSPYRLYIESQGFGRRRRRRRPSATGAKPTGPRIVVRTPEVVTMAEVPPTPLALLTEQIRELPPLSRTAGLDGQRWIADASELLATLAGVMSSHANAFGEQLAQRDGGEVMKSMVAAVGATSNLAVEQFNNWTAAHRDKLERQAAGDPTERPWDVAAVD